MLPTSLNYSMIRKSIDASNCKKVVVILDCCYSGAASIKGNNLKEILARASGSGTIILSASSEFDVAKEDEKLEHETAKYTFIESGCLCKDKKTSAEKGDSTAKSIIESVSAVLKGSL